MPLRIHGNFKKKLFSKEISVLLWKIIQEEIQRVTA